MAVIVRASASGALAGSLGLATLLTWVLTVGIGAYMLGTLIGGGGPRRHRGRRAGRPPAVLIGHFCLAISGLLAWITYLATGWGALAWSALGLLMPAIGLGISTVTIWTPFPGSRAVPGTVRPAGPGGGPAGRPPGGVPASRFTDQELSRTLADEARADQLMDELLARLLAGPPPAARRPRWPAQALIPVAHGIAAGATFLLVVLTVASIR